MRKVFRLIQAGPFTTVQDSGRYGYQRFGIPVSGALDKFSYHVANMLVGNPEGAAALEITFVGPKLTVLVDAWIAVTGADAPVFVNDRAQPSWECFPVRAGDVVAVKHAVRGVRSYLAVSGGFLVPEVMGSRSTSVVGKFGGLEGRPLARGDVLMVGDPVSRPVGRRIPEYLRPVLDNEIRLRCVVGPEDHYFEQGTETFFTSRYTVTSAADRMGYRLDGPALRFKDGYPKSIISEPSLPGNVQIPDGKPIIVLVEQTVGGYAKIATVISRDLDHVAQARPGDAFKFVRVSVDEAQAIWRGYRRDLESLLAVMEVAR